MNITNTGIKITKHLGIAICLAFTLSACSSEDVTSVDDGIGQLEVSKTGVGMVPGAWQAVDVVATDKVGAEETWTAVSNDENIASLSISGSQLTVTGVNFGDTTISVSSDSGLEREIPVKVYDHTVLDTGDLLIKYVDVFENRGYLDWGADTTWWHPVTDTANGWRALGSLTAVNYALPSADGKFWMIVVKEKVEGNGALKSPDSFAREGGGGTRGGDLAGVWYTPICPAGYVALGTVLGTRNGNTPVLPSTDDVTCVREDLTAEAQAELMFLSDRTPNCDGACSSFWKIQTPTLPSQEGAFLATGTFLMQGPDYTCTAAKLAGALCSDKPNSHEVMHVLAVNFPMIIDTPVENRVHALTGFDQPAVETTSGATKTMLVPFTALLSGDAFVDVYSMIHDSPMVQVERVLYNKLMFHSVNTTSVLQENQLEFLSGVEEMDSESFSHTAGISLTVEGGVEFLGTGGSASATMSYEFGYESLRSVTELNSKNTTVTVFTPPGKAAAAWQQRNAFRVKRHVGTELVVVKELEFGIDSYVVDEYPN